MATAPQQLPLFYNALEPLSSEAHGNFKARMMDSAPFLVGQHAIPVTVEEFPMVARFMPIVFTQGPDPVPLALMAMNEGMNVFVDNEGKLIDRTTYVPAYIRRYPYMLARLTPEATDLTLCFDPTAEAIGAFEEGEPLFADGKPTDLVRAVLQFNEQFEQGGQLTQQFMKELMDLGLLEGGEATIRVSEDTQPILFQGFQLINEQKLRDLRGDQLRKMSQSGMLPLIYAALFSLPRMSEIYIKAIERGLVAAPPALPAGAQGPSAIAANT